jgi:urease accessory protein
MFSPAARLLTLLQLVDSAFPTGAFAHSNGLEAFTQAGIVTDIATLCAFLETRLTHGLARGDLLLVSAAYDAQPADLSALDQLASASKTPIEAFEASARVGRRFLSGALLITPSPALEYYQVEVMAGCCVGHHPIAFGLACAAFDLPCDEALLAFAFNAVSGQVAAAVKLLGLGQTSAQSLLGALRPSIAQAAADAHARDLNAYAPFTPALDARAMQHAYLFRRLFIS